MEKKKIFVLLPDGVGLRNFAYSNFYEFGVKQNFDVVFWNNTPFEVNDLGFPEVKIKNAKTHPLTDVYKNARKHIELNLNIKKTKDKVYDSYRFPFSYKNFKIALKNIFTEAIIKTHNSESGLEKVRNKIKQTERKTAFYQQSLETLKKEKPDVIFCTNQRHLSVVSPVLAAQDLGIPTVTFIFSWDNLPKAMMVVETDYYFVWSDHMKKELLFYYPYIKENQIFVTGTPQFEAHADEAKIMSKESFFAKYKLDIKRKYICYSGDDVTTSPDDSKYLEDTAKAIREINKEGQNLGLIFRRCPVDFSDRYDAILSEYSDVIVAIAPLWKKIGEAWSTIIPTKEDGDLLLNIIANTEMVINLGSSMVFDYIAFNKPCAYINYDVANKEKENWSVEKVYKYVHFQSMPAKKAVFWIDSKEMLQTIIRDMEVEDNRKYTKEWFEKINLHPINNASSRIIASLGKIIESNRN